MLLYSHCSVFFFFNDTATTEIYTLSLHDALPISSHHGGEMLQLLRRERRRLPLPWLALVDVSGSMRSEEHTSELQSQSNLVCRLLLEKKKKKTNTVRQSIWSSEQWARSSEVSNQR